MKPTVLKKALFFVLITFLVSTHSYASWSIIAVDRKTGEIGIAGASCTFDVSGIASIVPGKGAIVVQAASNYFARMKGVELMNTGAGQQEILDAIMDEKFQPGKQQYGIILLSADQQPLVYSGSGIKEWYGEKVGNDFAVMGNILPGKEVVEKAFKAFNAHGDKSLAERLMLALSAGEQAGGDKRCGTQYARSAFLMIYGPGDGAIHKLAVQGIGKGGKPAVSLLAEKFDAWYRQQDGN